MKKKITVWNYLDEYNEEKEEIKKSIDQVLNSGRLILGQQVESFEAEFSESIGCKFGIGVNSGTDAIFLSLKALGVGKGDEVITVSNTAVPTVAAVQATGAKTRFVDINEKTFLMDTKTIESKIRKNTKAIVPVHLYGQCVDMKILKNLAKAYGIKIVEDCAQSHGALLGKQFAGSMSDVSAFSFYPTKILGGFGDGGMICTNSKKMYEKCKRLRFYGMDKQYYSLEDGYNSRLDELHASILRYKLKNLEKYIAKRKVIAATYDKRLRDLQGLTLPEKVEGGSHSYYLYVVMHKDRDKIIRRLKDENILVNISYPYPIHLMSGYKYLGYKVGDLPVTEEVQKKIFSLPIYPSLSLEDVEHVCTVLKKILDTI